MSTKHSKRAAKFNRDTERVSRHDKTFWSVRQRRDSLAHNIPEWEDLREAANNIKKHTITHLADYLEMFEKAATENGAHVHWAKDAKEYNSIVIDIMHSHGVRKVVKSKSMLTEECHLNEHLEKEGIDVVETDLGERILQLMHLAPSHIVMPAIHITKEEVEECFEKKGVIRDAEPHISKAERDAAPPADPTYLTRCARYHLRDNFMTADCGMTGANFGVAETGDIVVCTNEGNADMSTSVPKLHIVSMGIEKLIPDYDSLAVFQRLLARHGTGQPTTVYTSHFRKPRPGGEMHIILVDNGRSDILANEGHWQTLKCMRCGACMNTCPVYRRSGGYSYTYFIPGPIGVNLGMLRDAGKHYHNCSACSLCCSCDNVCSMHHADKMKKTMSAGMRYVFERPSLYTTALRMAPWANHLPSFITNIKANTWAKGHSMPEFAKLSFHEMWKRGMVDNKKS